MNENINLNELRDKLYSIKDNDLGISLQDENAISDIKWEGDKLKIDLRLIQPINWIVDDVFQSCSELMKKEYPDVDYQFNIMEQLIDNSNRDLLKGVKNIIVVASGKGGVGKSAISSNIAAALSAKGAKVGILDGDVYGPSQTTMFDLKDSQIHAIEMPDGSTVAQPNENYGIKVASMGMVMKQDEAAIVRGPMLAGYFSMLFEQIDWGNIDFLVFDLPPGTGDIQLTLTQKIPITGSVIVTTPQEIAVADVRRSIAMFNKVNVDIVGVVENMSYFVPPDMPEKKYNIFGEGGGEQVAKDFKVNFLGKVPLSMQMRENNDGGKPIVLAEEDNPQSQVLKEVTAKVVSEIRKLNYRNSQNNLEISV